ncbi:hypothetical protein BESB_083280 [Besnoitia besnoiti]|uniref:Uncharacterized protein n=1 Tax=Besnoitia besnoiti TaxID=94643 RepID=A0A2A9M5B1_BESBE|nr:hypothetical protein BESB_083280 [Besnoitia besnoiti]PFH33129.1 hypothetical protein BESB_083280 [Besnoitia besnoiti]
MASTPPARRAVVPIASASDQFRAGSSLRSPPSSVGGGRTASAARSGASSGGVPARRGSAQSRHGVRSSHGTIRHSGENGAPTSGARGGPSRAPSGQKGTGAGPRDRARPLTSTRSPEKLSGEEPGAANRATGPSKCAACGKSIEGGQRFMELAVTLPKSSSATSQQRKARGKASADLASDGAVVKAPFHLTCLHCSECGQALSDPPPGGASAQDSPIVISTQSAVEVLTGSQAAASQGRGLATKGAAGRKAPATQAALLQYFVAHAKCKERPCAVCHLPIALHDAKIALPDAAPAGEKQKAEPVGHRNRGQRGTQKSAEAAGGEGLRAG